MKKIIAFVMCSLLLITALCPCALALSVESGREQFDDGSYLIVTYVKPPEESSDNECDWEDTDAAESKISPLMRIMQWFKDVLNRLFTKQKTITKIKYCNYFDSEGKLLWSVSLKATFTYNYRKALCVSSEINYEIRDKDWTIISYDSSEENNTAKGEFAMRQYKLGVPLKLSAKELILTCDKNGNVN